MSVSASTSSLPSVLEVSQTTNASCLRKCSTRHICSSNSSNLHAPPRPLRLLPAQVAAAAAAQAAAAARQIPAAAAARTAIEVHFIICLSSFSSCVCCGVHGGLHSKRSREVQGFDEPLQRGFSSPGQQTLLMQQLSSATDTDTPAVVVAAAVRAWWLLQQSWHVMEPVLYLNFADFVRGFLPCVFCSCGTGGKNRVSLVVSVGFYPLNWALVNSVVHEAQGEVKRAPAIDI